jgi:sugar lactone lactonase YvrE
VLEIDMPRGFAADEKFVYWFEERSIRKIPIATAEGGDKTDVCTDVDPGNGPKIGGSFLYWAVLTDDPKDPEVRIMAVSKNGGPAQKAAVTKPLVRDLAADSSGVYWITYPGGTEHGRDGAIMTLASPGDPAHTVAAKLMYPNLLALDPSAGDVYFSSIEAPVVQRVPKAGGSIAIIDGDKQWSSAIAVTSKYVYWVKDHDVMRVSKAGGTSKVASAEDDPPTALTSDAKALYFATADGQVKMISDDDKKPKLLAKDQKRIDQLSVNSQFVFWETKNEIMALPK